MTAPNRALSWPLVLIPGLKLLLHALTFRGYGIFRDELYYVACSQRLDLGYVDHPPLSIALLAAWRGLFGESLLAMRLAPALAGALTVLLVGLITRQLGGRSFAQILAMTAAGTAPVMLALHHYYSMNALDLLVWAAAGCWLLRRPQAGPRATWLGLGVLCGLGLLNKISVLWLGAGLLVAILATPLRRDLRQPWPWLGGAVAGAIFLPHVLWQIGHGWPTLEFIANATGEKMVRVAPLDFLLGQVEMMSFFIAPLWLGGLAWLLLSRRGKPFRSLGWIYLTVFVILAASGSSRPSYLAPAYGFLLAAGAVALENLTSGRLGRWLRAGVAVIVVAAAALVAPFGMPLLAVDDYITHAQRLGVEPSTSERRELAALPQFYADMHGWQRIADAVVEVYRNLPEAERRQAAAFAPNYGVAGAIEVLGGDLGPPVISGHNNYWLWGPGEASGEVVLVVGGERDELAESYRSVELAAVVDCGHCLPSENQRPIFVARGLRAPVDDVWRSVKHFD
ncbi:MAG: glycosyltransferase family 39 protein [Acidobacteriota bacterium]